MGKDAFIAITFVLVPITSLSQGPMSQGPGSWVTGLGFEGLGSRVSGPDFRLCRFCNTTEIPNKHILFLSGYKIYDVNKLFQ